MTETATEAPATTNEEPQVDANAGVDEFGLALKERLLGTINERNEIVARLKGAEGDEATLLDNLRENSTNPEVQKYTKAIEELDNKREALWNKRDELLKPEIEAAQSGTNVEEETAKVDALDKQVRSALTYLKETYGENSVTDLPALLGRKNRSKGSGSGEGGKRIRGFDIWVDGKLATSRDANGVERSNFSAAAKAVGVDTKTLQEAFWKEQGTQDAKEYKDRVEFTITVGEGDEAKTHTVVAKRLDEEQTPQADDK